VTESNNKIVHNEKKKAKRTLGSLIIFIFKEILIQKKWVLLPLWILLTAMALILMISGTSSVLPAIYIIGF